MNKTLMLFKIDTQNKLEELLIKIKQNLATALEHIEQELAAHKS